MANKDSRHIDTKDNYFSIPVIDGEQVSISINGKEVINLIVPYNGFLKCYLAGEKKPILYKVGEQVVN